MMPSGQMNDKAISIWFLVCVEKEIVMPDFVKQAMTEQKGNKKSKILLS